MRNFTLLIATLVAVCTANECRVYLPDSRDMIVIDAEQAGGGGGWKYKKYLNGYEGSGYLVYKPKSNSAGVEKAPENLADKRIKTYWFKVNKPGMYRVVLKSAAPHRTDHNDLFMSLPESGAYKRRFGVLSDLTSPVDPKKQWSKRASPSDWFKVYQNRGGLQWDFGGKTVDFNGHDILTKKLRADGTWYSVRISGRSTKFNVDRIALYRCDGNDCSNGSTRFVEATTGWGPKQSRCENGH